MARILIWQGEQLLQEIPITRDATRIGRERLNHVHLADPKASRFHAEILRHGYLYSLEDKRSTNGTRLNDRPLLSSAPLADGDRIRIGDLTLCFELDAWDRPAPLTPTELDANDTLCASKADGPA